MVWSPLTTHFQPNLVDCTPRNRAVDSIGHHHAATTSLGVALGLFLPGGRTVTPNYCVWEDQIWGIVPEEYRAFTTGSPYDDNGAITYEIVNASGDPDWAFSETTLNTVARLDADIVSRYGVRQVHSSPGFWEHSDIYNWFGRSYPTACAGPSFSVEDMIARSASAGSSGRKKSMATLFHTLYGNSGVEPSPAVLAIAKEQGWVIRKDQTILALCGDGPLPLFTSPSDFANQLGRVHNSGNGGNSIALSPGSFNEWVEAYWQKAGTVEVGDVNIDNKPVVAAIEALTAAIKAQPKPPTAAEIAKALLDAEAARLKD